MNVEIRAQRDKVELAKNKDLHCECEMNLMGEIEKR